MPFLASMNDYDMTLKNYPEYWSYNLITAAAAGEITTQYSGDEYKSELVERNVLYKMSFFPPENAKNKTTVSIHWNIEKISMKQFSDYDSTDELLVIGAPVPPDEQFFNLSKSGPFEGYTRFVLEHERWIHDTEDLEFMNLDLMPGFRLRWYYTGDEVF